MKRNKFIRVFDSGFGGLDILKSIVEKMPQYDYIYLGDTARVPYGTRSQELIYTFTRECVDFLFRHNCQIIILACNTASSKALRRIQKKYIPERWPGRNVLGVLVPGAEEAAALTQNNKVGVIATTGTVASGAFSREIKKLNKKTEVFERACPLLVPLIENGEHKSEAAKLILEKYLAPLKNKKIDTLVLGCTHYGIMKKEIQKIIGKDVKIISEPEVVAEKLFDYFRRHPEVENKLKKSGKRNFFSTDITREFQVLGSRFFGEKIEVKKANL